MTSAARLVMVTGVAPGAGKSTVAQAIVTRAAADVMIISEDDVWGRREVGTDPVNLTTARSDFRRVIFDRSSQDPTEELTRLFDELIAECRAASVLWVQDWSWPELVALLWHEATMSAQVQLSRQLRIQAESLRPLIFNIEVEAEVAISRALAERGATWFNRHFKRPLPSTVAGEDVRQAAVFYEKRRRWQSAFLHASTWDVRHLDGNMAPHLLADEALDVVASVE